MGFLEQVFKQLFPEGHSRGRGVSIIFEVTAYDGGMVRLSETQWRHILFFHPEVEGEQGKIREVIITSYFTERVRKDF